jgi:hypothetical protein
MVIFCMKSLFIKTPSFLTVEDKGRCGTLIVEDLGI